MESHAPTPPFTTCIKEEKMLTTKIIITRLLVSTVLGLAIGTEREIHKHNAGVRTFSLICLGSSLAMIVSIHICQNNLNLLNGDPGRIAAQVLTGIGFIGAGLIIKNRDGISGLTTAASIFITAVIGLCVGAGMIIVGSVITIIVLFILAAPNIIRYFKEKR